MPELTASNPISAEISASDKPTGTKHITENGVYDVSVYKNADVDIPMPEGDIELTHNNQTYDVSDKATATVTLPMEVTIAHPSINDIIISPSQGYEGIKKLTMKAVTAAIDSNIQPENIAYGKTILGVNGSLMPPTLIQKTITANGTYSAEDDDADGYLKVTVNVPDASKAIVDGIIERSITTITSDATVCANYAFYYWGALTSVSFPNTTSVGAAAFRNCTALTAVSIPNTTFVNTSSFRDCTSLVRLSFPNLTNIAAYAFNGCTSLTAIILNQRATLQNTNAIPSQTIIYVENADLAWYSTATNWSSIYSDDRIKSIDDLPQ